MAAGPLWSIKGAAAEFLRQPLFPWTLDIGQCCGRRADTAGGFAGGVFSQMVENAFSQHSCRLPDALFQAGQRIVRTPEEGLLRQSLGIL